MAVKTYDPWGRHLSVQQSDYSFTGREWDSATGLYYYRARYYDPSLGRFLSEDPIRFDGGVNFYTYVGNRPVSSIDPFGLQDAASPWQVGWEWLTGGQKAHHFTDGDPFAEMLRRHKPIQDLIDAICRGSLPPTGTVDNDLSGPQGVPKYAKDYSTLLTLGATGNLAATYLGSYSGTYSTSNGTLSIHVHNTSTAASGFRFPVVGYTEWWKKHIGTPLNNFFGSGPMSATAQTFDLHEDLKKRCCKAK